MANVKFSQFANASALSGSDSLVGLQGGINIKATLSQVATFSNLSVTLQTAYNNNPNVLLTNGFPINITDPALLIAMNLDPGSRKLYTDYTFEATTAGFTSHLINQSIVSSHTITQIDLDRTNINNSTNNYVLTFPTIDTFDLGSTLTAVQQINGGSVQIVFPTGVFLNGVQNTSITVNTAYENITVRKIGAQQYMTVFFSNPPTLQEVYNNSGSPVNVNLNSQGLSFTNTSSTGTSFVGTDGSSTSFVGSFRTILNPVDQGVNGAWAQERFFGQSTFNPNLLLALWTYGFNYESVAGQESSYIALNILSQGTSRNILNLSGYNGTFGTQVSWTNLSSFNIGTLTPQPSALFQLASTTQGFLPPVQTQTQVNAISSPATGLEVFNSTTNTKNIFNGTAFQTVLTKNNVSGGTNVTIDYLSNPSGIIINASGGGSSPTPAYASWVTNNNGATTSVGTSFGSISIPLFTDVSNTQFTNSVVSVGGISTVISTYTGSNTQFFKVTGIISALYSGTATNYYLAIAVLTAGSSIITSPFINAVNLKNTNDYQDIGVDGIIELSTGDSIFYQLKSDSAANLKVPYVTSSIINITGSVPNTDSLLEGSNNLYLSQDGGSTYSFLIGIATVGNLPKFNSIGGELIDSGIAASSVINISKGVEFTEVTTTSATMTTNAAINIFNANNTSPVVLTLPATFLKGQIFKVTGVGTGGWSIAQNSGQSIVYESGGIITSTTVGFGGSLSSGLYSDCIELIATVDNTMLTMSNSSGASITGV